VESRFFAACFFAFVTPTLTLGQTVTPNPADGSYEWTWMGGHNKVASSGSWAGVYGKLGTPAAVNIPGSRQLAATWTDTVAIFGFLGDRVFDSKAVIGYLNDLWKFSPSLNEWTWMGGSANDNLRVESMQQSVRSVSEPTRRGIRRACVVFPRWP